MANAIIVTDIAQLHADIERAIQAQFPSFKIVEFYREETDRTPPVADTETPACLLQLSEMEPKPEEDAGTGQLVVWARFEARLMIGFRTPRAKIEIRKLAGALATWIKQNPHFMGKNASGAEVINILPDDFNPVLDRYEVWRVEWGCELWLGDTVWTNEGITPTTPLYSWSPNIGAGYADQYQNALPNGGNT